MMKIDIFNHILPEKYYSSMQRLTGRNLPMANVPLLTDPEVRIHEMEEHDDLKQVLTLVSPEDIFQANKEHSQYLANLANDEMARIIEKYPSYFIAGVASISLHDIDSALKQTSRAIDELGLKGIQLSTTIAGERLDSERFFPLYELLAEYDLPIWIHPCDGSYMIKEGVFNWPVETSWMMLHLACSGVFERYPDMKFITHHCGALIPTFHNRIWLSYFLNHMYEGKAGEEMNEVYFNNLKRFYGDTALYGDSTSALETGFSFFGPDNIIFGTDYPLDGNRDPAGKGQTANTIDSINRMNISEGDKAKIFETNAKKLIRIKQ